MSSTAGFGRYRRISVPRSRRWHRGLGGRAVPQVIKHHLIRLGVGPSSAAAVQCPDHSKRRSLLVLLEPREIGRVCGPIDSDSRANGIESQAAAHPARVARRDRRELAKRRPKVLPAGRPLVGVRPEIINDQLLNMSNNFIYRKKSD